MITEAGFWMIKWMRIYPQGNYTNINFPPRLICIRWCMFTIHVHDRHVTTVIKTNSPEVKHDKKWHTMYELSHFNVILVRH